MMAWESTIILSVLSWLDSEFTPVFLFLARLLLFKLFVTEQSLLHFHCISSSKLLSLLPPLFFNHFLFQKDFQGYHMSFSMKPYIYWWFIRSLCFPSSFFPPYFLPVLILKLLIKGFIVLLYLLERKHLWVPEQVCFKTWIHIHCVQQNVKL